MKMIIHIRNNTTGEVRRFPAMEEDSVYWTEGVGKCDCIRGRRFDGNPPLLEYPCGNEWHSILPRLCPSRRPGYPCGNRGYSLNLERTDTSEYLHQEF